MNLIFKSFFLFAFSGSVYLAVDTLTDAALREGLPVLPSTVAYFVVQSGLDAAISIYIRIITAGWIIKQLLSYAKTL